MADRPSYDRQLCSIGQSLEAQRITVFEIMRHGDHFLVRGEPEKEASLLATLRSWQRQRRNQGMKTSLRYTLEDIDEIDRQGAAHRAQSHRLPDFHRLANTLRTVGAYLESKNADLIELRMKQLDMTLLLRNRTGFPELEERTLVSFYPLFVQLHGRRSGRAPR